MMKHNYKIGDKVMVIGNSQPMHNFDIGSTVTVSGLAGGCGGTYGDIELRGKATQQEENDTPVRQWLSLEDISPVNTLTVGKTYTSANGNKWDCIFVRGGKAWLVGVCDGEAKGSAYVFDVDGTASWALECDSAAYNIVFDPVRETVQNVMYIESNHVLVRYDLINGTPDWSTAKVESCE